MQISSLISLRVFAFRNDEKVAALLVYFSSRRVATSMHRRISVLTSSGSQFSQVDRKFEVKTVSLRFRYSSMAQVSGWNNFDITRIVATKYVWIKS